MPYVPGQQVDLTVEIFIQFGWVDITSRGRSAGGLSISHARGEGAEEGETSTCGISIGNDDGALTEDNPMSPWYPWIRRGTGIRVSMTGVLGSPSRRFTGSIDDMELQFPARDKCVVRIEAIGTLGIIATLRDALRSAPYRYLSRLSGTVPVAAWTLEEGELATGAIALYGGAPMQPYVGTHPSGAVISYPSWGRGSLAPWLPPVVSRSGTAGLSVLWAPVSMPAFAGTWTVDFAYASGTDGAVSTIDVNPSYLGGTLGWPQLGFDPPNQAISVAFDGSPETITSAGNLFDGLVHHVRWTATQNGTGVDWAVYVDSALKNSGTEPTYTLAAMTLIASVSEGSSASAALGYLMAWTTPIAVALVNSAIMGHAGEQAHVRLSRLLDEHGIASVIYGTESTLVGPQRPVPLYELLLEIERADQGLLFDSLDAISVSYRTRQSRYNLTPRITINKGALTDSLRPRFSQSLIANDWTLTRQDGGTDQAVDLVHLAFIGRRAEKSLTVNVAADAQLKGHAGWRVAIGTAPGPRYTDGGINMRNPDGALLADSVLALIPGDRIVAASTALPTAHPQGGFDQMVLGWKEELDADLWIVSPNLVPSKPYSEVGVYTASTPSRYDSASSTLAAGVSSTATSLSVTIAAGASLWATGATSFYIVVSGIPLLVTNIAGAASPQTFTVTRNFYGYDKALASGDKVRLWTPARYGL